MTDENTQNIQPTTPAVGRGLKVILAVSLALNLAVVGIVSGVALKSHGHDGARVPDVRELNFGPFSEALSRPERRDLLRGFIGDRAGLREMRGQIGGEFQAVFAAVRANPFDPAALDTALSLQTRSTVERLDRGRKSLQSVILAMTPEERAAYADRLERGLQRRNRDGGRNRDGDADKRP